MCTYPGVPGIWCASSLLRAANDAPSARLAPPLGTTPPLPAPGPPASWWVGEGPREADRSLTMAFNSWSTRPIHHASNIRDAISLCEIRTTVVRVDVQNKPPSLARACPRSTESPGYQTSGGCSAPASPYTLPDSVVKTPNFANIPSHDVNTRFRGRQRPADRVDGPFRRAVRRLSGVVVSRPRRRAGPRRRRGPGRCRSSRRAVRPSQPGRC